MAHLQLVPPPLAGPEAASQREDESRGAPVPAWWRTLVVITLRYGAWLPPIWPLWMLLYAWRGSDVHRALEGLRRHLQWDGRDAAQGFCFAAAFVRAEKRLRGDPGFRADSEGALLNGRLHVFGLVATLDEEVIGHGYANILRHYNWVLCDGRTPLHDAVTIRAPRGAGWLFASADKAAKFGWVAALDQKIRRKLQAAVHAGAARWA
ncbi:hypothetical protein LBMAG42_34560 [Deltaproteobacteria bacterium]|nr:hypothetical protein LBMAG42_34560 [Deltaproteobacteria bacterium]